MVQFWSFLLRPEDFYPCPALWPKSSAPCIPDRYQHHAFPSSPGGLTVHPYLDHISPIVLPLLPLFPLFLLLALHQRLNRNKAPFVRRERKKFEDACLHIRTNISGVKKSTEGSIFWTLFYRNAKLNKLTMSTFLVNRLDFHGWENPLIRLRHTFHLFFTRDKMFDDIVIILIIWIWIVSIGYFWVKQWNGNVFVLFLRSICWARC